MPMTVKLGSMQMPISKEIVLGRVRYNTIRDAWRAVSPPDLPEITVRKRLELGWHPEDAFLTRPVPATERRGFKVVRNE